MPPDAGATPALGRARNFAASPVFFAVVPILPRLLALAVLACLALPAGALAADVPSERALYRTGAAERYLMDGTWLFRKDDRDAGVAGRWQRTTGTAGWTKVTVPNAWNATDESDASMMGGVGWYRKDFRLPSSARRLDWIVRFESVNYRSRIWLNGRPIGRNTGAYLPFEVRLPSGLLRRGATNRLVIRVDSRRYRWDFPPSGLTRDGVPTGGWWNYGGLLREVYLRKVDRVAFNTVAVRPDIPCGTCAATVNTRVTLRNFSERAQRVTVTGTYGNRRMRLGSRTVGAKRFVTMGHRLRIARPRLWSPKDPHLYTVRLRATVGGRTVARWNLDSGIRSVKVSAGRLVLNGKPVDIRGVGLHEDDRATGFAIDNRVRESLVRDARDLGATMLRSHYPLHPYMHELADRLGMVVWSEVPVYAVNTQYLKRLEVRKLAARQLEDNILSNQNHPSILVWSVGNELSARPGPVQGDYLRRAAGRARALDPTRPVGYAVAGYPSAGCQAEYGPLDVIGINEYFGWYPGPNGVIADRSLLSDYLDGVRACYPNKAVMITEFGAEANRSGPVEERGTYEHQQDFVNYHSGVYATKPWLSGSVYWALKEFRVRPRWDGGNPHPQPPIHQKGVVAFDGSRKPAFTDLQRIFRSVDQYPGQPVRRR